MENLESNPSGIPKYPTSMNKYEYTAINSLGTQVYGVVEGSSEISAINSVRNLGLYPTLVEIVEIVEVKEEAQAPIKQEKKYRKLTLWERLSGKIEL